MSTSKNPSTGPLLEVSRLNIATKDRPLVRDFNLTMGRGERVGLIGESGSGKSMTTTALMGLLPPGVNATGSVRLAGREEDLVTATDRQMCRIRGNDMAMVFQEPLTALNPLMKVGPQVAEVMLKHKTVSGRREARDKAVQLLASVKLPAPAEAAKAYPHQLSGGQRQRVMLAMALANDPGLLLCDEPTTALDVTVQRQVLDLILESVQLRGTGLLFITHDLSVVANVCDRVLVMNGGIVVEEGSAEEVFTRPQHPYTRGLLAASDLDASDEKGRLFTVASAAAYVPPTLREVLSTVPPTVLRLKAAAAGEPAGEESYPGGTGVDERTSPSGRMDGSAVGGHRPGGGPAVSSGSEAAMEPVISVKDLVRNYERGRTSLFKKPSEVKALRGISFDVQAGQRFGVVGESGSGKSTLLRILAGLDQPSAGSVRVAGNEVAGARESELIELRRELQIVFQDPMGSLNPRMRVEDIIAEPLLGPGQRVDSAL
ncbi:MAG TPA: ABC transporter ATP-binding protein, partial [Arthrobacter sp.]